MKKEISIALIIILAITNVLFLVLYLNERSFSNSLNTEANSLDSEAGNLDAEANQLLTDYNNLMSDANQLNSDWEDAYNTLNNCYSNDLPTCNVLTPNWS